MCFVKFDRSYIEIADGQRCFPPAVLAAQLLKLLQQPRAYALAAELFLHAQKCQIVVLVCEAVAADDHQPGLLAVCRLCKVQAASSIVRKIRADVILRPVAVCKVALVQYGIPCDFLTGADIFIIALFQM